MRIIKTYESFKIGVNKKEIDRICKEFDIENYTINPDGSIDVDDSVFLHSKRLTKLPLKFNKVSGYFYCNSNQLTSLEGSPNIVGLGFDCGVNQLTSLEGSPKSVGRVFNCSHNGLKSFEGLPDSIGGDFYCRDNPVEELWELFKDYEHIELFNDLDIIRDNKVIILQRLNEFLDMIEKPRVTEVKGYTCI